jgi:hypothetical protein
MYLNQLQRQWISHIESAASAAARGDWISHRYHLDETNRICGLAGFTESSGNRPQGMCPPNDSSQGNCNVAPISSFCSTGSGISYPGGRAISY